MLCGSPLISRPSPLIEADLERVRWLLDEVSVWDESLAPRSARRSIAEYYRRQEGALLEALSPLCSIGPEALAPPPVQEGPMDVELTLPVAPPPEVLRTPEPPPPSPELEPVAPPPGPSRWQLTWKPFLHESLGWFLGAFLILSGALYLVADAWAGMTSTYRALTVFGLVEVWAVGFAAWAAALSRKQTTRAAAVGLRRIAALVAPLAVLALGPALSSVFSWLALLGGSALAGGLTLRAAKDLEEPAARLLTASVSLATLGLGLAPVLPAAGGWWVLVPAVLAAFAFQSGPRSTPGRTWVSLLAFVLPVAALITRMVISAPHAQSALAGMWVALAVLASAALWLREKGNRGPLTVAAMSVFLVAFLASFAFLQPACVLIAVLGTWTTWRLSREATSETDRRAWWLGGTWVSSFLAWQRIDQLLPDFVWTWWDGVKERLGYSVAPMPPSYVAIAQALFIAVGTVAAGWLLHREAKHRGAHLWLRCCAIGGVIAGALALFSVHSDARPALLALPLMLVPLLATGVLARRLDAIAAGSVLCVFFAFAAGLSVPSAWPAGVMALVLALGAHALPVLRETRVLRRWLAGGALASGGVAFLLAAQASGPAAFATLVLGSVACVLAARALHRQVQTLAWFTVLVPLAQLESPLVMALLGLAGAGLTFVRGKRALTAVPALISMALLAPLWSLFSPSSVDLRALAVLMVGGGLASLPPKRWWWALALAGGALAAALVPSLTLAVARGWPWLVCAGALGLLSTRVQPKVRGWLHAPALAALVISIAPGFGLWAPWGRELSLGCAAALALAASVYAVLEGRSWRGALLATLSIVAAFSVLPTVHQVLQWQALFVPIAGVVLLATSALFASITVPLAALLLGLAWFSQPYALLAIAVIAGLLALLEESELGWRAVLNRSPLAWAASCTSALALLAALQVEEQSLPVTLAALLLPVVWARATRRAELIALGIAFTAGAGPWWVAPLLTLAAGRLLELSFTRRLLGLPALEGAAFRARRELEESVLFLTAAAVAGLSVLAEPGHAVAWFGAILFMGGAWPALRLAAAAAIAVPFEPLHAPVIGALVAVGAAAHHSPAHLRRWLGLRSLQYLEPVAAFLALCGAATLAAVAPSEGSPLALVLVLATAGLTVSVRFTRGTTRRALSGAACVAMGAAVAVLDPQWMVPVTIGAAAVLLGVPGLISAAILTAGLELSTTLVHGSPAFAPHVLPVAFVAAALAAALRWKPFSEQAAVLWRWLGRESDTALAGPIFWGALGLAGLLIVHHDLRALWLAPLLLITPRRAEAVAGLLVCAIGAALLLPADVSVLLTGLSALGFAYAGSTFTEQRVAGVWRHASWLLALLGIVLAGARLESPLVPLAWSVGAATSWLLLRGKGSAQGWAWASTGVALHVVMAFVGVVLSTGAPQVLILPWWAAASGSLALLRHLRGGRASVLAFASVALGELLLGSSLLASAQPREAVLSVLVAGVLALIAWRRVVAEDESASAFLGQCAVVAGALAARVLGLGALPDLTDAWVLLGVSALFAGLAQFLAREGRAESARTLRSGAMSWPLLGALLVPWQTWSLGAGWLLGVCVLAAWIARSGSKRSGTLISALALNGAVLLAALGSGFAELQLLLIPLGLTLLVLARVFTTELSPAAGIKLRAWGMGLMYVAVAWEPLTVTSVPALILCVAVCLGGVALGTLWRIRSYVVLGSGVLVTTVLATLVRSGLAEPRLGAIFLSLLGLAVVVVMVMISTRREELQARFAAMQRVMASWEA